MLSPSEIKIVLEAALLAAQEPLPVAELRKMFEDQIDSNTLRLLLEELRESWTDRGVELVSTASGWRFQTKASLQKFLERIHPERAPRYSRAVLETLAIIAYRQPVTRPEIEEIRGVDCGAVVKALLERKLVKILGKKEEPGRPILYGTTREFLEFFSLKDLASLPTLREFHELSEEHREIVEKQPEPEGPGISGIVDELKDERLRAELEAKRAEGDAALEELERAIDAADVKGRAAEAALEPKKDPEPEPEAGAQGGGAGPTQGTP
jgi:segregation and condensation protein B